jgi:hypothetical protein
VDDSENGLLSDANDSDLNDGTPDLIEMEWETGIRPTDKRSDSDIARDSTITFPEWAWPSVGDRVWVDGYFIFDCAHPKQINGVDHFLTEIHPPRAIASMREQVRNLPGVGLVPVTETDLYIHGRSGYVSDFLCGQISSPSPYPSPPPNCQGKGTPIDGPFSFDIPVPVKPPAAPGAHLVSFVEDGPGNTITITPTLAPHPATDPTSVGVSIDLSLSGVTPDDVYARKIYIGWSVAPTAPIRHFRLTLNKAKLFDDHRSQGEGFGDVRVGDEDCACSFVWMNLDRAPHEWFRLTGYDLPTDDGEDHTNTLDDWDDNQVDGSGELNFSGPTFDFFILNGQSFTLKVNGYGQNCYDSVFGEHDLVTGGADLALCKILLQGDNDQFDHLDQTFGFPDYGVGEQELTSSNSQYKLFLTVKELLMVSLSKVLTSPPSGTVTLGTTVEFTTTIIGFGAIAKLPLEDIFDQRYLKFVSASVPPTAVTEGHLEWGDLEALASGGTSTVQVKYQVVACPPPDQNSVTNVVKVAHAIDSELNVVPTAVASADVSITCLPGVNVVTTLKSGPVSLSNGEAEPIEFEISITNDGETTITKLPLSATFDGNCMDLTYYSVAFNGKFYGPGGEVTLSWDDLTKGAIGVFGFDKALAIADTVELHFLFKPTEVSKACSFSAVVTGAEDEFGQIASSVSDHAGEVITK